MLHLGYLAQHLNSSIYTEKRSWKLSRDFAIYYCVSMIVTNVQKKRNLAHRWRYMYKGIIGLLKGPDRFVQGNSFCPSITGITM